MVNGGINDDDDDYNTKPDDTDSFDKELAHLCTLS